MDEILNIDITLVEWFGYKYREKILDLIKNMSFIRMYLVGNESTISSHYSKQMIARENDTAHEEKPSFIDRCVFMQNEDIKNDMKYNFFKEFASCWQQSFIKPISLTELDRRIEFHNALFTAEELYPNRAIKITGEFRNWLKKEMKNDRGKEV